MSDEMSDTEEGMHMDCGRFRAVLDDLDRPGTPGMAFREAALAHAERCSRCAQLMTSGEALDFALRQIVAHDAVLRASSRVETALLCALRQQKAHASRRRGQWRMAMLATAAALLLAAGLSLRHFSLGDRSGTAANKPLGGTAVNSGAGSGNVEVAQNLAGDSQETSAFVSLPYATDPATLEDGTVVRVELTRSTLAAMGMPVTDAGSFDRIPADIMLSEDGVPQAIRLVSSVVGEQ